MLTMISIFMPLAPETDFIYLEHVSLLTLMNLPRESLLDCPTTESTQGLKFPEPSKLTGVIALSKYLSLPLQSCLLWWTSTSQKSQVEGNSFLRRIALRSAILRRSVQPQYKRRRHRPRKKGKPRKKKRIKIRILPLKVRHLKTIRHLPCRNFSLRTLRMNKGLRGLLLMRLAKTSPS